MRPRGDGEGFAIRAARMREVVERCYEPGRQDRCLYWVWRTQIWPVWGVKYRTFLYYLKKAGWTRPANLEL